MDKNFVNLSGLKHPKDRKKWNHYRHLLKQGKR